MDFGSGFIIPQGALDSGMVVAQNGLASTATFGLQILPIYLEFSLWIGVLFFILFVVFRLINSSGFHGKGSSFISKIT